MLRSAEAPAAKADYPVLSGISALKSAQAPVEAKASASERNLAIRGHGWVEHGGQTQVTASRSAVCGSPSMGDAQPTSCLRL